MKRKMILVLGLGLVGLLLSYQNCAKKEGEQSQESSSTLPYSVKYSVIPPMGWNKFMKMTTLTDGRPQSCLAGYHWCKVDIQGIFVKDQIILPNQDITICHRGSDEPEFVYGGCIVARTTSDGTIINPSAPGAGTPWTLSLCFDTALGYSAIYLGDIRTGVASTSAPITQRPVVGGDEPYSVPSCP